MHISAWDNSRSKDSLTLCAVEPLHQEADSEEKEECAVCNKFDDRSGGIGGGWLFAWSGVRGGGDVRRGGIGGGGCLPGAEL